MLAVLEILLLCIFLALLFGFLRTFQLMHSKQQKIFLKGRLPFALPDGFIKGSVAGPKGRWLGKKFDYISHTGINIFDAGAGKQTEKYPFATRIAKASLDGDMEVIQIDYDVPQNWFWVRMILDEIVEIETGHFIGKLQYRLLPGIPFTLAFFELKR